MPKHDYSDNEEDNESEAYDLEGNSSEEEVDMEGHVSDTDGEGDPLDSLLNENQIEDTSDSEGSQTEEDESKTSPALKPKNRLQALKKKAKSKAIVESDDDSDEEDFAAAPSAPKGSPPFLKPGDIVTFKNGGGAVKGKQGFVIKYPSDRTNIVMDLDPTKTPTEKIIKDEVVKRKLVFNDLGYVVLLSDKDDRTKRNPGVIHGGFFYKRQFFCYPVTKQIKLYKDSFNPPKGKEKRQAKLAEIVRDNNRIKGMSHVVRGMTFDGFWFSTGAFDSLKQDTNRNKDPTKPPAAPKASSGSKKRKQPEPEPKPEPEATPKLQPKTETKPKPEASSSKPKTKPKAPVHKATAPPVAPQKANTKAVVRKTKENPFQKFFEKFDLEKEYKFVVDSTQPNKKRIVTISCQLMDFKETF